MGVLQYPRSIADLRPMEIPPHYWVNLSVGASVALGVLCLLLALYLVWSQ